MLYSYLLSEIFNNPNNSHILLYIAKDTYEQTTLIKDHSNDIKALIKTRNKLANFYKWWELGNFELPNLIDDIGECNWCFSRDLCSTSAIAFDELTEWGNTPNYDTFKEM